MTFGKFATPSVLVRIEVFAFDTNAKTSYDPEVHPHVIGPLTKGFTTNKNGLCSLLQRMTFSLQIKFSAQYSQVFVFLLL